MVFLKIKKGVPLEDDPPMIVGSTYPSMAEFKIVLSQNAIKREFEYNTEKSAPSRFSNSISEG